MKMLKRPLAVVLMLCMLLSLVPVIAFAADTQNAESDDYRILHLDCGRKYFTKDWIIALINEMAAAGYNQLQLAFGNDGLRFLLDDMSVTVNGTTYSSANVTAGIQAGNIAYYDAGDVNELTESEMDEIIAHAQSAGISIIPLLNNPGHMNTILSAIETLTGSQVGYDGSDSTINLENADAVAITKALVQKYVTYFAGKGCSVFNMGADEYANDVYSTGSMGFGALVSAGKYQLFVNYVNAVADMIKTAGMVPMAFNDGIYFNGATNYTFDTEIMVAFWSSGWTGYQSAAASTMRSLGHEMINVHGDYYYVLGKNDKWTPDTTTTHDANLYTEASAWDNNAFMGSTVSDPSGSMFCIWCDYPAFETETQIAANVRLILRAMAAEMQGNDAASISTEVVAGGFNEDGSINTDASRSWVTVTAEDNSGICVSGYDLTGVTATEVTDLPEIDGAVNVKAWDITPSVDGVAYTENGSVKLPVPEGWNTACLTGFYVENGEAVLVKGTYADGFYTFDMPHFSVAGLAELDYNHLIELTVGESMTELLENVDLTGNTYTPDPSGIANVTTAVHNVTGSSELVQVTSLGDLVSGGKYVLVNKRSGNVLGVTTGYTSTWGTTCLVQSDETASTSSPYWTITVNGSNYYFQNSDGSYMTISSNSSNLTTTQTALTMYDYSNSTFGVAQNGYYLNDMGGAGQYAGGYNVQSDAGAPWYIYQIVETQTSSGTEVTFTGEAVGETYVTINGEVYKIVVHGTVPITIKYQTEDGTVIKTETVTVVDNATTYSLSNFNHDSKYYTVADTTLNITPATVTEYTVTVTEITENLDLVTDLSIEYWQTNARAEEQLGGNVTSKTVTAVSAYSEEGIDLSSIIPVNTYKVGSNASDPALSYWRSRLLPRSTDEQTGTDGDDETLDGTGFTKVRYWNGSWAVYTDAGAWQNINLEDYQLVAYYMNDMNLADEVKVSTSDWGKKGNGEYAGSYLGANHVSIAFQVVYEDGTTAPAGENAELAPYTYLIDHWGNRGVGVIAVNRIGDYQIWKITAETGEHDVQYTGQYSAAIVNGFTWDDNEMTVWEDAQNPVSQYTILNPSSNPNTEGYYDNLRWDEANESILIRIYIKAVETEDSLKVVYYDEKFGVTLQEFNISVPSGSNFNNGIVEANSTTTATLPEFAANAERKDATGYGIINSLDKTQNFETDLSKVAVTNNRYNAELYSYTGSVISDDGKTITHYYSINQSALSPNFVADFGLSFTFKLSDVVKSGIETVTDVTVKEKTLYGTLSYDSTTKEFTYTPTQILPTIDVLTISIAFDGGTPVTTNVGVTPATTVYYEQTFLTYDSNWTVDAAPTAHQKTEILGSSSYYGYDDAYKNGDMTKATATTVGATASFTFTGTGFELYANSTAASGYVAVFSQGSLNKLYMIDTKLSAGTSAATNQQTGTYYSLPIISEKELPYGTYTVTIKITKDTGPVDIDGVRIINAIDESSTSGEQSIYFDDEEDLPVFYQLRDAVLNAIGVEDLTASGYIDDDTTDRNVKIEAVKDMAGQVYNAANDATAIILSESISYGNGNAQDLLDNGPKNELYLYPGQTLVFSVTTDRVMQLGLKAPTGSAKFTLTVDGTTHTLSSLSTTVDMFYKIAEKGGTTHTVSIEVSEGVLSVTDLKICDDPNFTFNALTQEDIESALMSVYGLNEEYADAVLSVVLKDRTGRELGTVELSANGVVGESAVFTAEQILAAAKAQLPRKYAVIDKNAVADIEVGYGQTEETTFRIGKIFSLRIVFGNHWGNKQPFEGGWASWLIPEILYEEG